MIKQVIKQVEQIEGIATDAAVLSVNGKIGEVELTYSDIQGEIPSESLPSYVDDVIEGTYINATTFQVDGSPITPESGKIYVDTSNQYSYRWSGSVYVRIVSAPDSTVQLVWSQGTNINVDVGVNSVLLLSIDTLNNKYFDITGDGMAGTETLTITLPQINSSGSDFGKRLALRLVPKFQNGTYSRRPVNIQEYNPGPTPKILAQLPASSSASPNKDDYHVLEVSNLRSPISLIDYPLWYYNTDYNVDSYRPTSIKYDDLKSLRNSNSLRPGQRFIINDFELKWWDSSSPTIPQTYSSGVVEPLIVSATSSNKISHIAYSTLHPEDIVYYNFDATYSEGWGSVTTAISGFKGWIYRRIDTLRNIDIGWDWRYIKSICAKPDLSGIDLYDTGVTYAPFDLVKNASGKLYYSVASNNIGQSLENNDAYWRQLSTYVEGNTYFAKNNNAYLFQFAKQPPFSAVNIPILLGSEIQKATFTQSLTSDDSALYTPPGLKNIKIRSGYNNIIRASDYTYDNIIEADFINNTIGVNVFAYNKINGGGSFQGFYENFLSGIGSFSSSFSYNEIDGGFHHNFFCGNCDENLITTSDTNSDGFAYNYLSNFRSNFIQNSRFRGNYIATGATNNKISCSFLYNIIGSNFFRNKFDGSSFFTNSLGPYFRYNAIEEPSILGVNFLTATHIYNLYNTKIFRNSNSEYRLSYFNEEDQLVVTDMTA
jgi:hypothetical protein